MRTKAIAVVLVGAGLAAYGAERMKPRQLWNDDDPAPKPAAPKTTPPKTNTSTAARSRKDPAPRVNSPSLSTTPVPSGPAGKTMEGVEAIPVGSPVESKAVALRYSLFKIVDNSPLEVSPDTRFHSGDRVQIAVEGSREGYLWVVARGSSGNWKPMFPAPGSTESNRIVGRRAYQLPSEDATFEFDEQKGEEHMFVVFSPDPIDDLDGLIYSLRGTEPRPGTQLLAKNIDDRAISKLRDMNSRDLIIQKMDDEPSRKSKAKAEHAVYVAKMNGGRVVADLRLIHE